MKSFLVAGVTILLIGGTMAIFGAVYSATIYTGRAYDCGTGCQGQTIQNNVTSYYAYPMWSPPTWSHVNYNVTHCTIQSWYTPFSPPPSCIPPPVSSSANYLVNFIGIVLVLLGVVMIVRDYTSASTLHDRLVNRGNKHQNT